MQLGDALLKTMTEYDLGVVAVASKADINYSRLSRYLAGTPIKSDGVDRVLATLDDETFRSLIDTFIAHRGLTVIERNPDEIPRPVAKLSAEETADVLNAIAKKIREDGDVASPSDSNIVDAKTDQKVST